MPRARITVTLPDEIVREIDRRERNRSRFVLEAVRHELDRRRREELMASVGSPHALSEEVAEAGFGEWADWGDGGGEELLDADLGRPVQWSPEDGWTEGED